jgi:hypothetical protein
MSLFGLLVIAGVVLLIIWAVRQAGSHPGGQGPHTMVPPYGESRPAAPPVQAEDPAVTAARHRYAQGEITKEQLDEILANLRQTG